MVDLSRIPVGTPIEHLPSIEQSVDETLADGTLYVAGVSSTIFQRLAAQAPGLFRWPCGAHSFVKDDRVLVAALHEPTSDNSVRLDVIHFGLPVTGAMLGIAYAVAMNLAASGVQAFRIVAPDTPDKARRLARYGFRRSHPSGAPGVAVYTVAIADFLPAAVRRRFRAKMN